MRRSILSMYRLGLDAALALPQASTLQSISPSRHASVATMSMDPLPGPTYTPTTELDQILHAMAVHLPDPACALDLCMEPSHRTAAPMHDMPTLIEPSSSSALSTRLTGSPSSARNRFTAISPNTSLFAVIPPSANAICKPVSV
ncbi:uncharacterized protein SETTUDRAFT_185136 [Exserohilum turcica Et28A]|uniref:Uncharacterized protein n=1 Tax=Exserohilum turcicum (strain 28A) TaxID=671987 RepID=R0KND1_EXST2|nr:uncharacterized protein SETTUDRAFT_185136 [Exserohilum turcica Et28A]EOA90569.1 hypothetical protein SETTUDRAFT_185136 [Exserohilum turcica Et28A]